MSGREFLMKIQERLRAIGSALRITGVLLTVALALGAFAAGVATNNYPDLHDRPLAWIYFTASLFVFGGTDLGVPDTGPMIGRGALWAAYFLAPLITTSAVAETLLRLLSNRGNRQPELHDHVIIVGADYLAVSYLEAVREMDPGRPILLIAHTDDRPPGTVGPPDANGVSHLEGNVRNADTLRAAGASRASRAIAITSDDLVNLECAWALRAANAELRIAAHVADLTLLRPVNKLVRPKRGAAPGARPPLVFSTHRIASLHLYENCLQSHFQQTGYRDNLVIAGFGHLGQTMLELLAALASEDIARVVILDPAASRKYRQFAADVDLGDLEVIAVDGRLDDPASWEAVDGQLGRASGPPVFLLSSHEPLTNFRAAMLLRGRSPGTRVFVRCFNRTAFAESLAAQLNVELLSVQDVLRDALKGHYDALAIA
jgi:hypothetical protein